MSIFKISFKDVILIFMSKDIYVAKCDHTNLKIQNSSNPEIEKSRNSRNLETQKFRYSRNPKIQFKNSKIPRIEKIFYSYLFFVSVCLTSRFHCLKKTFLSLSSFRTLVELVKKYFDRFSLIGSLGILIGSSKFLSP